METYRLIFKNLSAVSALPDGQTIFGAVCAIISSTQKEEKLKEYLASFEDKPLFVHSSMFVNGILPMPKVGLISIEEKNEIVKSKTQEEKTAFLNELKKFKKVSGVEFACYRDYIADGKINEIKEALFKGELKINDGVISHNGNETEKKSQLIFRNKKKENNETELFYDTNTFYSENALFDIYVKTDDIELVKNIFKYSEVFGFGNRVSVGKNCFRLVDCQKVDFRSSVNQKVLLSKCISDEFDLEKSSYMIESALFGGSKYYSSNKTGMISKFVEGSYMVPYEEKEFYGKVLKLNNDKDIYHYGIGFVL